MVMNVVRPAINSVFTVVPCKRSLNRRSSQPGFVRERSSGASDLRLSTASTPQAFYCYGQRAGAVRYWRVLLTNRSGTRTKRIMLLYTNKANNVFDCLRKKPMKG